MLEYPGASTKVSCKISKYISNPQVQRYRSLYRSIPVTYRDVPVQLAFCIGFILSLAASLTVGNWEQQQLQAQFQSQGNKLVTVLEQNINTYNSDSPPLNQVLKVSLRSLNLKNLNFYLYDSTATREQRFLAFYESSNQIIVLDSGGQEPVYTENRLLCASRTACTRIIKVGKRKWSLLLLPTPSYAGFSYYWRTWITLAGGWLLTAILVTYLLMSLRFISWHEMLETLSMTDPLTGLLNRRAMDLALPQMLQQVGHLYLDSSYRYLSVLIMDVDHFKRVNDSWGHLVGDCVLKAVARRLKGTLRSGSLLYRYGGEEFVCITRGLSPEMAWEYGEFLRSVIADESIIVSEDLEVSITISVGVAIASFHNKLDSQTLLAQADAALYKAKHEGRNCLRMS